MAPVRQLLMPGSADVVFDESSEDDRREEFCTHVECDQNRCACEGDALPICKRRACLVVRDVVRVISPRTQERYVREKNDFYCAPCFVVQYMRGAREHTRMSQAVMVNTLLAKKFIDEECAQKLWKICDEQKGKLNWDQADLVNSIDCTGLELAGIYRRTVWHKIDQVRRFKCEGDCGLWPVRDSTK